MKKLSDVEKELIHLELEKSKLNRERSLLVINKSMFMYFSFLFVGVIGFINNYLDRTFLNILIMMGLSVLIIGTVPYIKTMKNEERTLQELTDRLKKKL